jgi:hypothetical protein
MRHGQALLLNPTMMIASVYAQRISKTVSVKVVASAGTSQSQLSVTLLTVKRCLKLSDLNLQRVNHVKV